MKTNRCSYCLKNLTLTLAYEIDEDIDRRYCNAECFDKFNKHLAPKRKKK